MISKQTDIFSEREIKFIESESLVFNDDFANEAEFCDWIENDIHEICAEEIGYKITHYEREFNTNPRTAINKGKSRRVDFFLRTEKGENIIVECKAPKDVTGDLTKAIGQILTYKLQLERRDIEVTKSILLSTKYCPLTAQMIGIYQLPIEFIIMDKSKRLKICLRPMETNMP